MTVYLISTIQRFTGLAADDKPTSAPIGSRFLEADTPAEFIYYGGDLATGVLTFDAQPEALDTILIGSTTYTYVEIADFDAPGEISIGANVAAAIANTVAAINGTDGVNAADAVVSAGGGASTVTITALEVGDPVVATVYTNAGLGTNAFADATLQDGIDAWVAAP